MSWSRKQKSVWIVLLLCVVLLLPGAPRGAQAAEEEEVKNPYTGDAAAIEQGKAFFRLGCAFCHAIDARGSSRGPDLTVGRWNRGGTDAAILRTITDGVPGTEMPASSFRADEKWMIIAFLRSLGGEAEPPVEGDPEAGRRVFFEDSDCAVCHMIKGEGGRLGPDLSRIGASRSPQHLVSSIRQADEEITEDFEYVVVTTKEGRRVEGIVKNEDTFSIQILSDSEEFHLFLKRELSGIEHRRGSLMPSYGSRELSEDQLRNMVAYLDGLRGR